MWSYNELKNYYYCFLGKHELIVQPFQDSYKVRFCLSRRDSACIQTFISEDNIEDAQRMALKIVRNHAIENFCLWNKIMEAVEDILEE
jgi:hypothetical protein